MRYVAFGLQVNSPFALPGMIERTDATLPSLDLDIHTRESLLAAWGAGDAKRVWEGRLGDGRPLLVEASSNGEYLFAYESKALFRLHSGGEQLACAPCEDGIAWQRVLLTKVLANVSLLRGYEALHASAVESPGGAVVVLAPSGTGKTALALALALRGWPLMSDDIVTLGGGPDGVLAQPGTPHLNADLSTVQGRSTRKLAQVLGVLGEELWLAARAPTLRPRPVRALCLLERGRDLPLKVDPMPASPVWLMPYALGLLDGGERERFELYAELAAGASVLRVSAGDGHSPAAIAELLQRQLGAGSSEPVRSLA